MLPLSIESFFYPEISIVANQEYIHIDDQSVPKLAVDEFECNVEQAVEDNRLVMHLRLYTTPQEKPAKPVPYKLSLQIIGMFPLEIEGKDLSEEKYLFSLNSSAMVLYGALRERVNNITSQMPFGALTLPIQVISFEKNSGEQPKQSE